MQLNNTNRRIDHSQKMLLTETLGHSLITRLKLAICHQLKFFYFVGHDMTSIANSWLVWLLSQHEEVLAKLHIELKEHGIWMEDKNPPTYEQLHNCNYLDAVVKESLCLYPPATLAWYSPNVDKTLGGYTIGGDTDIIISPYVIHHHPFLWKEPEIFRPEHFFDGSKENLVNKC